MTDTTESDPAPATDARLAAVGALLLAVAALAATAVGLRGDLGRAVVVPLLVLVVIAAGWVAVTRTGVARIAGLVVAGLSLAAGLALVLTADHRGAGLVLVRGARRRVGGPCATGAERHLVDRCATDPW